MTRGRPPDGVEHEWEWGEPVGPGDTAIGDRMQATADVLAPYLLGAQLESTVGGVRTVGVIVEVEAYLGLEDPASHAAARIGRTRRNESMFGAAGSAYVYLIYGMHHCVNVVAGPPGSPWAVLVRALEPLGGRAAMQSRRGRSRDLCNGPGRLCQALGIDRALDGHDLSRAPLRLVPGWRVPTWRIGVSARIGISRAADWPLRFFVDGHPDVSGTRRGRSGSNGNETGRRASRAASRPAANRKIPEQRSKRANRTP